MTDRKANSDLRQRRALGGLEAELAALYFPLTGTLGIGQGGTGATTVAGALANFGLFGDNLSNGDPNGTLGTGYPDGTRAFDYTTQTLWVSYLDVWYQISGTTPVIYSGYVDLSIANPVTVATTLVYAADITGGTTVITLIPYDNGNAISTPPYITNVVDGVSFDITDSAGSKYGVMYKIETGGVVSP